MQTSKGSYITSFHEGGLQFQNNKVDTFDDYMKSFFDVRNVIDVGTYTDRGWHQKDL